MKYRFQTLAPAAFAAFCVLAAAGHVIAFQSPEAAEVTQAIESARASKTAGRIDESIRTMAALLKKYPANTEAARFQVTTFAERERVTDALTTYDAYVAARKRQDPAVLAIAARADLARTARLKSDQPPVMAKALERLARDGDAAALRSLRQASASATISPQGLAATISLAKLKDPAADATLTSLLRSSQGLEKAQVIQAITEADARSLAPRVLEQLSDGDANVRNAAATALGRLQYRAAIPQLKAAFDVDSAGVKLFAAIALKQLGQTSADTFLLGILNGQIAELRVMVARAWQFSAQKSPDWDKAVRTLLGSQNEQHRLEAAELMACCDQTAARSFLVAAIGSPNPLLRGGAAKILEARKELATPEIARRLLGDATETVRVYGAGLALAYARDAK